MNLDYISATEALAAMAENRLSSVALLEHYIARTERLDGDINAVPQRNLEAARARAKAADEARAAGTSWGALHGLPMTIKDSFEVTGMPCTSGAPPLKDHRPKRNADAVQRLEDAGAIIWGKTNLPLFAGDFQSYNGVYGTTNNPWNHERTPGGSSGGSAAALAAGFTSLELGSDIGGSIRGPAHMCGVLGHKPSRGIISLRGHIPGPPGTLSTPDLAVAGPLARTPDDLDLLFSCLVAPDPREAVAWRLELPPSRIKDLKDVRVAVWLDDPHCPVDTQVGDVLQDTVDQLAKAGVTIDQSARPVDPAESRSLYMQLLYAVMGGGFPETVQQQADKLYDSIPDDVQDVQSQMMRGVAIRHRMWLRLNEKRNKLRAQWSRFFKDYDLVLCPAYATTAFPHDHSPVGERTLTVNGKPQSYLEQVFWAGPATTCFLPASSVPCGIAADGLPVNIQVVGPYLEDHTVLHFSRLLCDLTGGTQIPKGL